MVVPLPPSDEVDRQPAGEILLPALGGRIETSGTRDLFADQTHNREGKKMPTTGEFCVRHAVTAERQEPILDVARRMRDEHVGCLVVVERDSQSVVPVGIVTDRDLVVRALASTAGDLHSVRVADVMTEALIKAWEDDDLAEVLKRMRSFGVRRMPVVNRKGELRGIVALDDIVEFLQEQVTDMSTLLARERQRELKPI